MHGMLATHLLLEALFLRRGVENTRYGCTIDLHAVYTTCLTIHVGNAYMYRVPHCLLEVPFGPLTYWWNLDRRAAA